METKEKKPIYKRKWFIVIVVILVLGGIGSAMGDDSEDSKSDSVSTVSESLSETQEDIEEEKEEQEEVEEKEKVEEAEETKEEIDIAKEYDNEFIAGAKMVLDNHIANYKMSLAPQKWTIAKFDETETLIGMTKITYKDVVGDLIFCGTLDIDEEGEVVGIKPHYIEVQGNVIGDDGYCTDIFNKINGLTE